MKSGPIQPFTIAIPQDTLDDLQKRLENSRWLPFYSVDQWEAGTPDAFLRELTYYWRDTYDWRAQEQALNQLPHFQVEIEDTPIHFIHQPGQGPNPFPLLLCHGWPDSFFRFSKIIPMLTDPASFGGSPEDAFTVVVPDMPGFGFSGQPAESNGIFHTHDLWAHLMTDLLGYEKFGVHGGDWGTTVTELIARDHARHVAAIHLTDVPFGHLYYQKPSDPTPAEQKYFAETDKWIQKEGAYAHTQSTKPSSLAPGLNDSPIGLAAWITEKFHGWSDVGDHIESSFSKDELLTNIMIYWVTGTIRSSFQPYYDRVNAGALTWTKEAIKSWIGSDGVPTAFALFPKDISRPPRAWAERFFNVQRWTEMPRGGHFAALEEPQLLAEDLRAWFRPFRERARQN